MKSLTDEQPKCLIEIHGRALIDWQISALRQAGIDDIAIVTGYKSECLSGRAQKEFHNPRWQETNMVSSLECAAEWIEEGDFVVSYSDIFYAASAVSSLINTAADLAIVYDINWLPLWNRRFGDPLLDAETFRVSAAGTLLEIGAKPSSIEEIEGQYMGLLYFGKAGWREVIRLRQQLNSSQKDTMHMTGLLQKIIDAGRISIAAVPYSSDWGEVDTAADLAAYAQVFKPSI